MPLVLVVITLSGCSRAELATSPAELGIIDDAADWRAQTAGDFVRASDGQGLDIGDNVRTDETGFAEIQYPDGSLTRLDVLTVFRVGDLAGTGASPAIDVGLDSGRTWNRVRAVTGATGSFEVETAVGVAAVRGTAFSIDCGETGPCSFAVTEGTVELERNDGRPLLIPAGTSATVTADGDQIQRGPVPADLLGSSGWIGRNLPRDDETGHFGGSAGSCSASIAGQNLLLATTPQTAAIVDVREPEVPVAAAALGDVDGYTIDLLFGPWRVTAAEDVVSPPDREYTARLVATDYAFAGTGLYRVEASSTGTVCTLAAYVRLVGRSPLSTILGVLGMVLLVFGFVGMAVALLRSRRARRRARESGTVEQVKGNRTLGVVSGGFSGIGAALLFQQYGFVALGPTLLAGGALLGGMLGLLAGWPWGRGHNASGAAPQAQSP